MMSQFIELSIIIPVYNNSELLKCTLQSIVEQAYPSARFEVVVVDDGSSENIQKVILGFEHLNIRYYRQEDEGFRVSSARNIGVRESNGKIILYNDNGMLLSKEVIKKHVVAHSNQENLVILGNMYGTDAFSDQEKLSKILDANELEDAFAKMIREGDLRDGRMTYFRKFGEDVDAWYVPWLALWSGHFSVGRKLIEEHQIEWNESFKTWGGEDIEYGIQLDGAGAKMVFKQDITCVRHPRKGRISTEVATESFKQNYQKTVNHILEIHPTPIVEAWVRIGSSINKPQASVIIPIYNRINELILTLDSLVQQNCKYLFEVIVADDGSEDDVKDIVNRYSSALNIKYGFHPDRGFRVAATRNMGIRLATSDLCIFIDNGIILHSQAVETHIDTHLEQGESCGVIGYIYGFHTESISENLIAEIKGLVDDNQPDDAISLLHERNLLDPREKFYKEFGDDLSAWPAPFVVCWTGNLSIPRETLLKIGMFDESFTSWGGEDTDLGLSLQKEGIPFVLSRKASSVHYPHEKDTLSLWDTSFDEALKEHLKKKEYLLNKHPIQAMKAWMDTYDPFKLNQVMLKGQINEETT